MAGASVSTARAWLAASRPRTLTASVGPVALGCSLAAAEDRLRPDLAAAALAVAVGLQIGANLYNDYGDFVRGADDEGRLGPPRAAQSGWLAPSAVRAGAIAAITIAAVAGLHIVQATGWPALAIGAASIASAVLYTAGPAPLAYVGLGELFVVLFFGGAAVAGSYYVFTGGVSALALAAALSSGLLGAAILVVNNLRDRDGDRRAGKRTLVVRFGERFGRLEYAALIAGGYAVPLAVAVFERRPALLLPLLSLPLAAAAIRRVAAKDGAALNEELGRTAMLGLGFDVLFAVGVLL